MKYKTYSKKKVSQADQAKNVLPIHVVTYTEFLQSINTTNIEYFNNIIL